MDEVLSVAEKPYQYGGGWLWGRGDGEEEEDSYLSWYAFEGGDGRGYCR